MNNLDLRHGDLIQYRQDSGWIKAKVDAVHEAIISIITEDNQLVILNLEYQPHLDLIAAPL